MSLQKEKIKLEMIEELNKLYKGLFRRDVKRQKAYVSKLIQETQEQGEMYVH